MTYNFWFVVFKKTFLKQSVRRISSTRINVFLISNVVVSFSVASASFLSRAEFLKAMFFLTYLAAPAKLHMILVIRFFPIFMFDLCEFI